MGEQMEKKEQLTRGVEIKELAEKIESLNEAMRLLRVQKVEGKTEVERQQAMALRNQELRKMALEREELLRQRLEKQKGVIR